MAQIREAELPADLDAVQRLWLAYLTWGNDGLEDRYGFRLPIGGFVERDLRTHARTRVRARTSASVFVFQAFQAL